MKRLLLPLLLLSAFVTGAKAQYTDEEEEIVVNIEEDTVDIVPQIPMTWEESFRFRLDSMLERHRTATVTVRTRVPVRRGRRNRRYTYTTTRKTITLRDRIGIAVWDLTSDSMIYRHNSEELFIPASNQKIFVAVAALDDLGAGYHFKTDIRTDLYFCRDSAEHEYVKGNIYIHDRFDPTLDKEAADYIAKKLLGMDVDSIDGSVISYLPLKNSMPYQEWFWNKHSSRSIVQNVVSSLKNDGVTFSSNTPYTTFNNARDSIGDLYTSLATPLPVVLKRMMKNSDNAYAESMLLNLVNQDSVRNWSYEACKERVRDMVRRSGARIQDYTIQDGSGLSHGNKTTPEVLTSVLRYAYRNPRIYRPLLESMPEAGMDGTLSRRMRNTLAHSKVRAKTGTVNGVSTLSGYLKAQNGHVLAFSILMNSITGSESARSLQNILCIEMCR
ncbi:MAG: D-alanyl-D-alanine carboxypeptidase/D-alanyl-D-alanine-endopeptidase [Bacteroidaceae bacterium]|nr:D-alanyl-D-alanine carboxypeptidase/D-alanyl-D-alanine-endopeptidase [Bacteroidaceae bacterium]